MIYMYVSGICEHVCVCITYAYNGILTRRIIALALENFFPACVSGKFSRWRSVELNACVTLGYEVLSGLPQINFGDWIVWKQFNFITHFKIWVNMYLFMQILSYDWSRNNSFLLTVSTSTRKVMRNKSTYFLMRPISQQFLNTKKIIFFLQKYSFCDKKLIFNHFVRNIL